jgi:hypothetical protein
VRLDPTRLRDLDQHLIRHRCVDALARLGPVRLGWREDRMRHVRRRLDREALQRLALARQVRAAAQLEVSEVGHERRGSEQEESGRDGRTSSLRSAPR